MSEEVNSTFDGMGIKHDGVGMLLFGLFDFLMVILVLDTVLQVQQIFSKSHISKMATAGSTRQWILFSYEKPTTFTTYNMKIGVWPAILVFFDYFSQKLI